VFRGQLNGYTLAYSWLSRPDINYCLVLINVVEVIVGLGTMLHAVRLRFQFPMSSLIFSFFLFLTAALWPWGLLSL
jgi:hypothetical protein